MGMVGCIGIGCLCSKGIDCMGIGWVRCISIGCIGYYIYCIGMGYIMGCIMG